MAFVVPFIPLIISAVGTGVAVYGAIESANQQKKMADENEAMNLRNAQAAREKAAYDATMKREENRKLLSRQRVLYAKAGVDINSGTPLMTMAYQADQMEEDARNIESMGEVNASQLVNRARLFSIQGSQAVKSGNVGAVGTILTGASTYYGIKSKGTSYPYSYDTNPNYVPA